MSDLFDPVAATPSGHPGIDRWNDLINATARKYSDASIVVPANLIKAHMLYESGGDPGIIDPIDGGAGLMQITYDVVHPNGIGQPPHLYHGADILDPGRNVEVAVTDFIRPNMNQFPTNLDAVIAAYNAGSPAVAAAVQQGRDLTQVTYAAWYIPKVRDAFAWLNGESHRLLGR
jgi:soluble lytic murein transglycosylase-like protein